LGQTTEFKREEPQDLFLAYSSFMRSGEYANILECFAPSLQPQVCRVLREKVEFDRKALALATEIGCRYGQDVLEEFETSFVEYAETVYRRAFYWRRKDIDFSEAVYVWQEEAVIANVDDVPFGLIAVRHGGKWYLSPDSSEISPDRPELWIEDLEFLEYLLRSANEFLDHTRRDIVAGRIDGTRIREILSHPTL
jgi:hypothetical protein